MSKNSNPSNPFGVDFTKFMGDFKMPSSLPQVDMEQGIQTIRRNMEAVTAVNQVAMEGCQALIRRQMEIARAAMQETTSMVNELAAAGTPEDKVARQLELVKQAYETSLENLRELQEMAARSNGEAMELISDRVAGCIDEAKVAARKATRVA